MVNPLLELGRFFRETIWLPGPLGRFRPYVYAGLQILFLAGKDLLRKRALVRTSALAYSSILALIPLLALLFAIFKGIGLQRQLAAHLLPQLAGGSQDFARQILEYVEGTNVASLGVFGVIWLLVALMFLMANVEQAFNHIWGISRSRSWWRKLSDYLSIFLLFPILMAVAISLTTTFQRHPEVQQFMKNFLPDAFFSAYNLLFSFGVVWLGFTFVYLVMPYTRVQFISAVLGGITGGALWQVAQWIFHLFQSSAPYYNAIYGALYQLLFLVIWMFWSWLIVLYGAEVAYVHQNLTALRQRLAPGMKDQQILGDEFLALAALLGIVERFQTGGPPMSLKELTSLFNEQESLAVSSVEALQECGLIASLATSDHSAHFLPTRSLEEIRLKEVLTSLRRRRWTKLGHLLPGGSRLEHLAAALATQPPEQWQDLTLREMLLQSKN